MSVCFVCVCFILFLRLKNLHFCSLYILILQTIKNVFLMIQGPSFFSVFTSEYIVQIKYVLYWWPDIFFPKQSFAWFLFYVFFNKQYFRINLFFGLVFGVLWSPKVTAHYQLNINYNDSFGPAGMTCKLYSSTSSSTSLNEGLYFIFRLLIRFPTGKFLETWNAL